MSKNTKIMEKAARIVESIIGEGSRLVLSQIDLDGYPTSATITASKAEGLRTIYFCTGLESNKAKRIRQDNRSSICYSNDDYNISLVGKMEIVTDPILKEEMWYGGLSNHFKDHEDPGYCVLKFTTERYNILVDWTEIRGHIFKSQT